MNKLVSQINAVSDDTKKAAEDELQSGQEKLNAMVQAAKAASVVVPESARA